MPNITFMRHGETTYNQAGIFTGRSDCNLSEEGIKAARNANINQADYDLFFCSTLKRTKQTLDCFTNNAPVIYDERIVELDMGEFTGKPITNESKYLILNFIKAPKRLFNVETQEELDNRVNAFIDDLFMQYSEDTNILVVCHNRILRSIKGNYFENYQDLNSSNLETVTIK